MNGECNVAKHGSVSFRNWQTVPTTSQRRSLSSNLAYEREAARYGLFMLHEANITNVNDWFSAYSACDQAYLLHYYRTAEKGKFRDFWPERVSFIEPKQVPAFKPIRRTFRMDGIVI